MAKQLIHPPGSARPGGSYSPCLRVRDFIFVSGQGPIDSQGNIIGNTIEEQTTQTMNNIKLLIEAAGATMSDVVKTTVHLSDLSLFNRYNAVYETYFPDPRPARTTVGSQLKGIMVEIDAIAYVGK